MMVILREAIEGTATITVDGKALPPIKFTRKHALRATECAHCGRRFRMARWCNDAMEPGQILGTFDQTSEQHGNGFHANVCGYDCGGKLMQGGWKELKEYREFALAGANLIRCELGVTGLIKWEPELIAEWEAAPDLQPNTQRLLLERL